MLKYSTKIVLKSWAMLAAYVCFLATINVAIKCDIIRDFSKPSIIGFLEIFWTGNLLALDCAITFKLHPWRNS